MNGAKQYVKGRIKYLEIQQETERVRSLDVYQNEGYRHFHKKRMQEMIARKEELEETLRFLN